MNTSSVSRFLEAYRPRLYTWALQDARREVEQDYPLLRTFQSGSVHAYLHLASTMSERERLLMAQTTVKHYHRIAGRMTDIEITEEEAEISERLQQYLIRQAPIFEEQMLGDKTWLDAIISTAQVVETTLSYLAPTLGMQYKHKKTKGRAIISFVTPAAEWYLRTEVSYQQFSGVTYNHQMIVSPSDFISWTDTDFAFKTVNLPGWMGLGFGQFWFLRATSDLPAMGMSLQRACSHFLAAFPSLVEGLPKPLASEWAPPHLPR